MFKKIFFCAFLIINVCQKAHSTLPDINNKRFSLSIGYGLIFSRLYNYVFCTDGYFGNKIHMASKLDWITNNASNINLEFVWNINKKHTLSVDAFFTLHKYNGSSAKMDDYDWLYTYIQEFNNKTYTHRSHHEKVDFRFIDIGLNYKYRFLSFGNSHKYGLLTFYLQTALRYIRIAGLAYDLGYYEYSYWGFRDDVGKLNEPNVKGIQNISNFLLLYHGLGIEYTYKKLFLDISYQFSFLNLFIERDYHYQMDDDPDWQKNGTLNGSYIYPAHRVNLKIGININDKVNVYTFLIFNYIHKTPKRWYSENMNNEMLDIINTNHTSWWASSSVFYNFGVGLSYNFGELK